MGSDLSESLRLSVEEASVDGEFSKIIDWIEHFLSAPHADLGRTGDVCPFARAAMLKRSIEFYRNISESVSGLSRDVETHMEEFHLSVASQDIYRCRIIVPSRLDDSASAVEYVQSQLKPAFVERHLMIGQFYQECEAPGLWNRSFRPLQAPVPLIAIRRMVPTDVAFLYGNASYMRAYFEVFGKRGRIAFQQFEAAKETRQ